MSCRYKNECPSYSGWCDGPKQDFSQCVEFLINAYENEKARGSRQQPTQVPGDGFMNIPDGIDEELPFN